LADRAAARRISGREIGPPQDGCIDGKERSIIMLIAPFSASPTERPLPLSRTTAQPARTKPSIGGILVWLSVGICLLLLVPFARGDRFFGATLPFWLVVAPLVDLVWVERRHFVRVGRTMGERIRSSRRLRGARRLHRGRASLREWRWRLS
jgi:hypothetical protein